MFVPAGALILIAFISYIQLSNKKNEPVAKQKAWLKHKEELRKLDDAHRRGIKVIEEMRKNGEL